MKRRTELIPILICSIMMLLLIWDTPTTVQGASTGIELCIKSVIPSLFPFFVVSTYLNSILLRNTIDLKFPRILSGSAGAILLIGLTGGYPVGAQLISQAYHDQQISKRTGHILLGYCNNSGPAFIFGITAMLFPNAYIPFILWGIQILSAILTGYLLPRPEYVKLQKREPQRYTVADALKKSIYTCAIVCGWIILFRIILSYISVLFTEKTGITARTLSTGFLELSNGCLQLAQIPSVSLRFTLCSTLLSFGGLCVMFQTASAVQDLGLGFYIPGKIIQTAISTIAAAALSILLFPDEIIWKLDLTFILQCGLILLIAKEAAKRCGNSIKDSV